MGTVTTTKWNNDPKNSPCFYKEKCYNSKKGLIDGAYRNCREECHSFQKYLVLKEEYILKREKALSGKRYANYRRGETKGY